ncbi:hypothetical protein HU200_019544 [Digitaria exilis]|uniref:Secreted protein n=1 Tax=Digitaria exilis TaxID=1010633 RepID=A0A835KD60_9POAL|nr:hypothetical protein HU200_019544 [Digitaria exilis]
MNDKCGGLGCMMVILFLKLHMTVSSGRPHLLEVRPASTRSNATALDESKLTLVFCQVVRRSHTNAFVACRKLLNTK